MILLLENKTIRQNNIDFTNYNNIETILGDDKCNPILDIFLRDNSIFSEYDMIIIHENIYYQDKREELFKNLEKYCEDKKLVKFSGNNSQSYLNENILTLSAKKLYENIEIYLTEDKAEQSNILMLAYGKNWDLNPLLNILQELNLFIENFDEGGEIDFDDFEDDFDLLQLKRILKEEEYQLLYKNLDFEDEVSIEEMRILSYNFKTLIQVKSND